MINHLMATSSSSSSSSSTEETVGTFIEADSSGLWAVHVPVDKCPANNVWELSSFFNKVGPVRRTVYNPDSLTVMYGSIEEAVRARGLLSNDNRVGVSDNKPDMQQMEDLDIGAAAISECDCLPLIPETHAVPQITAKTEEKGKELIKTSVSQRDTATPRSGTQNIARLPLLPTPERGTTLNSISTMTSGPQADSVVEFPVHHSSSDSVMPSLQPDASQGLDNQMTGFKDMPPLKLAQSDDGFPLDCSIYVANFPSLTPHSLLLEAFSKYHVLDICMLSNTTNIGSTKAFMYLATAYDVIDAVLEMNGSGFFGCPLKVDVPFTNRVMRRLVWQEKAKRIRNMSFKRNDPDAK